MNIPNEINPKDEKQQPIEAQTGPDDIIDTEVDDADAEKDETQKELKENGDKYANGAKIANLLCVILLKLNYLTNYARKTKIIR